MMHGIRYSRLTIPIWLTGVPERQTTAVRSSNTGARNVAPASPTQATIPVADVSMRSRTSSGSSSRRHSPRTGAASNTLVPRPMTRSCMWSELSTRPRPLRDPLSMTGGNERAARLRELRERTRVEPGSREESECALVYESFEPLNREVLHVCTDWQVRPGGALNDHGDAAYDWSVIDRLTAVDERAGPLLR